MTVGIMTVPVRPATKKMSDRKSVPEEKTQMDGNVETKKPKSRRRRGKHTEDTGDDEKNKIEILEKQDLNSLGNISIKDIRAAMEMFSFYQKPAKTPEEALHKSYQFWNTQPVPKMDEKITANEAIEPDKGTGDIRAEPYSLPDGFQWDTLNLNDPLVLKELYTLLNENYVEDDDCMFRFDYQPNFLKWYLTFIYKTTNECA